MKLKYIYAGLRRRFIYYFKREYFNRQLAKRAGECSGLGHCCKLTRSWCPYLKGSVCVKYGSQPFFCKIFPIDEKDKELSDAVNVCTYHFVDVCE